MSVIRHKMVEVDIEFYGLKNKQEAAKTPLEFHVEMIPETTDPTLLSEFYFEFLIESSKNLVLNAQPVFWNIVNNQLKQIHKNADVMFTRENLVEVEPKMTEERKERCSMIKTTYNDHGHVKYKLSHEGHHGLESYYVPIGAMAFLQYIVNTLTEEDIHTFYDHLAELIQTKREHLSKYQQSHFELETLPPYSVH